LGCSSRFSVKNLVKILLLKVRARAKIFVEGRVIAHDALAAIDGRHQLSGIARRNDSKREFLRVQWYECVNCLNGARTL